MLQLVNTHEKQKKKYSIIKENNIFATPTDIPGRVIPKTQKMVLDPYLLNTQYYKVRIKGKVEQSRERSGALPDALVL